MAGWADLLAGFNAAYDTTGNVMRDYEIAKIAKTGVKELPGKPVAANADIQAEIDADPNVAAAVAPKPRFEFLGKEYDARPDEAAVDAGRQLAMAGVYEKYGDVAAGMGMRRAVRRDALEEQALKVSNERLNWEREDRKRRVKEQEREDAYVAGRQAAFNGSIFGQRNAAYAQAMDKYQRDQAAYDAAVEAGNPPPVAPVKPAPPQTSWGEALLDHATLLAHDIKHGKAGTQDMLKFAELQKTLQDEGYSKALTMAQSGAPLTQVVAAFNGVGQERIDPASIISDKMVDRGAGVKSRVVTYRGPDGATRTIDTLAELDAIGKADKVFARAYAANADARGAAAAGRAAAEFAAGAPQRQLGQRMAQLGLAATDPNATPEQREAARALLAEGKGADKDAPAQVKLAEAIVRSGLRPDMKSALEFAMTAKDKSPEALKADLYKAALTANFGDAKRARETTEEAMRYLSADAASSAGGGGMPEPKTPEEHAKLPAGTRYRAPDGSIRVK